MYIQFVDHYNHQRGNIFLVPMHGGIWTLCTDLEEIEINFLRQYDYSKPVNCENYLAGVKENHTNDENRADWQHSEWLYTKTGAYPNASNHISFRHHSSVHRPDLSRYSTTRSKNYRSYPIDCSRLQ